MNPQATIQASADAAGELGRDSLNGCVPCHVMRRGRTGAYYPHPREAMLAYADEAPWAPLPDGSGWASLDNRTLIVLD